MARVTSVTVRYARKINLGDYSSADIEVLLTAEPEGKDTPDLVVDSLFDLARTKVREQAGIVLAKVKAPNA
jgi:hypothetical protein